MHLRTLLATSAVAVGLFATGAADAQNRYNDSNRDQTLRHADVFNLDQRLDYNDNQPDRRAQFDDRLEATRQYQVDRQRANQQRQMDRRRYAQDRRLQQQQRPSQQRQPQDRQQQYRQQQRDLPASARNLPPDLRRTAMEQRRQLLGPDGKVELDNTIYSRLGDPDPTLSGVVGGAGVDQRRPNIRFDPQELVGGQQGQTQQNRGQQQARQSRNQQGQNQQNQRTQRGQQNQQGQQYNFGQWDEMSDLPPRLRARYQYPMGYNSAEQPIEPVPYWEGEVSSMNDAFDWDVSEDEYDGDDNFNDWYDDNEAYDDDVKADVEYGF